MVINRFINNNKLNHLNNKIILNTLKNNNKQNPLFKIDSFIDMKNITMI